MLLLLLPMLLLSMLLLPVSFEKSLFLILQKFLGHAAADVVDVVVADVVVDVNVVPFKNSLINL
jgi:hypothetical protein